MAPKTFIHSISSRRWLLLGVGIASILGLTLMNVYSLWKIREFSLETSEDAKRGQLREVRAQVGERIYRDIKELWQTDMGQVEAFMKENGRLPDNMMNIIATIANDSLFSKVYFTQNVLPVCESGGSLMAYNRLTQTLEWENTYPGYICDGLELVRTKTKTLLTGDYRWYTKTEWDANRTMNIALVNTEQQTVVGYLTIVINNDWFLDKVVTKILVDNFGTDSRTGMTVYVRDWLRDEIVATNNINVPYDASNVSIRERFTFENWQFQAIINENPTIVEAQHQFIASLIVLGIAVVLLLSSIVIIFRTAMQERELSTRQAHFLANVTHELKTPLAVMQAAGENLADGRVVDSQRLKTYGRHIHEEALRLSGMIEKLLNVARYDAGNVAVQKQVVRLCDLVNTYLNSNKTFFADLGYHLDFTCSSNDSVNIDTESFATIIRNLVDNAIKYSEQQRNINLRVFRSNQELVFEVEDFGIGIPEDQQSLVFNKFYRVEDPMTATTKGHGLGLAIVKHLTELNGGVISLKSQYGYGSIFTVRFPIWNTESVKDANPSLEADITTPYAIQR